MAARKLDIPIELARSHLDDTAIRTLVSVNGKNYSTWGIGPAAALYLPWWRATGRHAHQGVIAGLLAAGTYLFTVGLITGIFRGALGAIFPWARILVFICLGLGNLGPLLITQGGDAQISSLWSRFWLAAAAYYFSLAFQPGPSVRGRSITASLCLGCAVAGHPSAAPLAAIAPFMTFFRSPVRYWRSSDRLMCFLVPCLACLAVVGYANFVRFGTWYEFGSSLGADGHSELVDALLDPSAVERAARDELTLAHWNPLTWITAPVCEGLSSSPSCLAVDLGLLGAFPVVWLLVLVPLLLICRKLAVLVPEDGVAPLPVEPTLFLAGATLIGLFVALSGMGHLIDPTNLPAGLDWALTSLSVIYAIMGLVLLRQETGWYALSSIIVPVCLTLSIVSGLLVSL